MIEMAWWVSENFLAKLRREPKKVPDITFGTDGKCSFPTKYHGNVTLSKAKWDIICGAPEKVLLYLQWGKKFPPRSSTRTRSDITRRKPINFSITSASLLSVSPRSCFSSANGTFFAVVIDALSNRVCTVYPVPKPKPGNIFQPKPVT